MPGDDRNAFKFPTYGHVEGTFTICCGGSAVNLVQRTSRGELRALAERGGGKGGRERGRKGGREGLLEGTVL